MDQLISGIESSKLAIFKFATENGFPVEELTSQRILGPRIGGTCPSEGTEIFVSKLPREIFEDELIPYFEAAGKVYKFRLMLCVSGATNRGFAYITYEGKEAAQLAVQFLNNSEIKPGHFITVEMSQDNRRIFVGGIPDRKKKDEIWHELQRCGMSGIIDVIMYRSYTDRNKNRGFVFVEFRTHQEAAVARRNFRNLILFEQRVQIDWSTPIHNVEPDVMNKVKKLFLRNLSPYQERHEFANVIIDVLGTNTVVEKIYKHRDYAFIHFKTRRDAQRGISVLKAYFTSTDVEVTWAKPPPPQSTVCSRTPSKYTNNFNRNVPACSPHNSNNALVPNPAEKRDYVTLMDMINYLTILDS